MRTRAAVPLRVARSAFAAMMIVLGAQPPTNAQITTTEPVGTQPISGDPVAVDHESRLVDRAQRQVMEGCFGWYEKGSGFDLWLSSDADGDGYGSGLTPHAESFLLDAPFIADCSGATPSGYQLRWWFGRVTGFAGSEVCAGFLLSSPDGDHRLMIFGEPGLDHDEEHGFVDELRELAGLTSWACATGNTTYLSACLDELEINLDACMGDIEQDWGLWGGSIGAGTALSCLGCLALPGSQVITCTLCGAGIIGLGTVTVEGIDRTLDMVRESRRIQDLCCLYSQQSPPPDYPSFECP